MNMATRAPELTTAVVGVSEWSAQYNVTEATTTTSDNVTAGVPGCHPCTFPLFDLILNMCVMGSLCLLGLAGNTLSILVLQKERSNRVAVLLLQSLAVADNACLLVSFIIGSVFMGLVPNLPQCGSNLLASKLYVHKYLTPLGYMTQTATIWITVLLAANRYIAVCRPFQAQRCLTLNRTKLQVAAVAAFSILFNLPRLFQVDVVYDEQGNAVNLNNTSIGESSTFGKVYTNALYSLIVLLLPLVLLLVLNVRLIRELRASKVRMHRNSISTPPESQDDNITFIMVIIIIVFLVCHTPDRILQVVFIILKDRGGGSGEHCSMAAYMAQCFCNLLFIINSSVNFLIYYVFRKRFRKNLKRRVCGWIGNKNSDDVLSLDSGGERARLNSPRNSRHTVVNGNSVAKVEETENAILKS